MGHDPESRTEIAKFDPTQEPCESFVPSPFKSLAQCNFESVMLNSHPSIWPRWHQLPPEQQHAWECGAKAVLLNDAVKWEHTKPLLQPG